MARLCSFSLREFRGRNGKMQDLWRGFLFFFKTLLAGSQLLAGGIVCVGVFSFFLYGVPPLKSERVSIRDMFRLHSRKVLWREPIKVFRLC